LGTDVDGVVYCQKHVILLNNLFFIYNKFLTTRKTFYQGNCLGCLNTGYGPAQSVFSSFLEEDVSEDEEVKQAEKRSHSEVHDVNNIHIVIHHLSLTLSLVSTLHYSAAHCSNIPILIETENLFIPQKKN